ncbi:1-acyl-sn-glycerol-3-phosphate acyltransferase [Salinihabitans flavidus]|uniref:1-acyl-sn-glycerol-3-phosphate acyltransferase n=1 Tax=Salinihabitans flavidus TaxID=569882 RepID=A0A1H8RZR9_9RHOB|nr:lysophospholipid acyltransferase family protein [Salinihabitans flavidus]SEO72179.1 1-acyl-sn-glycerol-3-phosphate acyltransferase [Salinihabitans flavidus]
MPAIGTLLFYGLSGVTAIPLLPLFLLYFAPHRYGWWFGQRYLRFQLWLLRVTCGVTYRIEGTDNLPAGPVIYASQHQSAWETLYFQILLDNPVMFAKKEIFHYPLIGLLTRWNGHIPVDRRGSLDSTRKVFQQGVAALQKGRSLLIYPSGTRDRVERVQSGIGVLYQLAHVPVVPVLLNSGAAWPPGRLLKFPGQITVRILPPIAPGLDRRTFLAQLQDLMQQSP